MGLSFRCPSWIVLLSVCLLVSQNWNTDAFVPTTTTYPAQSRRHHGPSFSLTALSQKDAIRSTAPSSTPLIQIPRPQKKNNDDDDETLLTRFQQDAASIVTSYQPTTYDPWITNCHVQTIGAYFLRGTPAAYVPRHETAIRRAQRVLTSVAQIVGNVHEASRRSFWDVRERIDTPDGDWFHADSKVYHHPTTRGATTSSSSFSSNNSQQQPRRRMILVHGLESNSNSSLVQEIAQACGELGMNVTCLNFRSCSVCSETEECLLNDNLGAYHLGFTDDLKLFLDINKERRPDEELYLTGFSLGANAVLKTLGELGVDAVTTYNIQGAAVANAPFDQEINARALARPGINRFIYTNELLKSLKAKAIEQWMRFGDCENPRDVAAVEHYYETKDLAAKCQTACRQWQMQLKEKIDLLRRRQQQSQQAKPTPQPTFSNMDEQSNDLTAALNAGVLTTLLASWQTSTGPIWNDYGDLSLPFWFGLGAFGMAATNEEWGGELLRTTGWATRFLAQVMSNAWETTAPRHQNSVQQSWETLAGTVQDRVDQVRKGDHTEIESDDLWTKMASLAGSLGKASLDFGKESLSIMANVTIGQALKDASTKKKKQPLLMEESDIDDVHENEMDLLWDKDEEMSLDDAFDMDPNSEEEVLDINTRPFESQAMNSYYNSLVQESANAHKEATEETTSSSSKEEHLHLFDLPRALAAKTVTEFDDAFIAPIYDFDDCWDYYRKTSSGYFLESIAVPSFVLNAKDDPFFDPAAHPIEKTVLHGGKGPIHIHRTDYGGHCGFCFQQYDDEEDDDLPSVSWMPSELARFLGHVIDQKQQTQSTR